MFARILTLILLLPSLSFAATGINVAAQGSSGPGVCSLTRTFTQADIYAWTTTPLTLVPTPITGMTILPLSYSASYNPTTTRYVLNGDPTLYLGSLLLRESIAIGDLFAAGTFPRLYANVYSPAESGGLPANFVLTSARNQALQLRLSGAAVSVGDGDVTWTTRYYLLDSNGQVNNSCLANGVPGPVLGVPDKADVALYATAGGGTPENPWIGWEAQLAYNRSGTTCTTPTGYSTPTCLWQSGLTYLFRGGSYTQTLPVVLESHSSFIEGTSPGTVFVTYNPSADNTTQFTFGKSGLHAFYVGFKNMQLFSAVANSYTKTGLATIDTSFVHINGNVIYMPGNTCNGNSVAIDIQGREFLWVKENHFIATLPAKITGQPIGSAGANAFRNLGVSRFTANYYQGCDRINPLITFGPRTVLSDVQFLANTFVFGGYGVYWVADYTGHDSSEKGLSQRVVFEDTRWEQMDVHGSSCSGPNTTQGGYFFHIDLTDDQGLVGLKIRNSGYNTDCPLAAGQVLHGIRLRNVHDVEINSFQQVTYPTCGWLLDLSNTNNVRFDGGMSPALPTGSVGTACTNLGITSLIILGGGVCKTFDTPAGAHTYTGFSTPAFSNAIHPMMLFDIPASIGSCLP